MSTPNDANTIGARFPIHSDSRPDDAIVRDQQRRRSIRVTVYIPLTAVIVAVTGLNVAQPHLDLGDRRAWSSG